MNDASFKRLLRAALAMSMASPAVIVLASSSCGGATSDGVTNPTGTGTGTTSPTTTTSPTGTGTPTTTTTGTEKPPIPDAAVDAKPTKDAGCTSNATLPPDNTCSRFTTLPCGVDPDSSTFTQQECQKLCPSDDGGAGPGGGTAFFCNVDHDAKGEPFLACHYCVIGRRPEGLAPVDRASGTSIGAYFADASHLEAASVEAFETLGSELASLGAPKSLLDRASRAAQDEVRHARTTAKLARRFGASPRDWSQRPSVSQRGAATRSLEEIALENAVEGCVRETFGALTGMWQAEHASDPHVRAAMRAIAEDELRHAALAWSVASFLRPQLDAETSGRVDRAMRDAIDQLSRDLLATDPPSELVDQVGLPTASASKTLLASLDSMLWSQAA